VIAAAFLASEIDRALSKSGVWVSFLLCPHTMLSSGRFKMVYIDGAYYLKAQGTINNFETPQ
jgi:hypothetical protein